METSIAPTKQVADSAIMSATQLLKHWQGHRSLTRKLIETYPADKLFTYSIGGMRTFAELAREMLVMGAPSIRGLVAGKWPSFQEVDNDYKKAESREELRL